MSYKNVLCFFILNNQEKMRMKMKIEKIILVGGKSERECKNNIENCIQPTENYERHCTLL